MALVTAVTKLGTDKYILKNLQDDSSITFDIINMASNEEFNSKFEISNIITTYNLKYVPLCAFDVAKTNTRGICVELLRNVIRYVIHTLRVPFFRIDNSSITPSQLVWPNPDDLESDEVGVKEIKKDMVEFNKRRSTEGLPACYCYIKAAIQEGLKIIFNQRFGMNIYDTQLEELQAKESELEIKLKGVLGQVHSTHTARDTHEITRELKNNQDAQLNFITKQFMVNRICKSEIESNPENYCKYKPEGPQLYYFKHAQLALEVMQKLILESSPPIKPSLDYDSSGDEFSFTRGGSRKRRKTRRRKTRTRKTRKTKRRKQGSKKKKQRKKTRTKRRR
jgi:hypothetical protein